MFLGLRFVLPVMVKQGHGAVVNTASIASERGLAGACAYNASKHGVVGLTRTAASEAGPKGVRVNCVMPGVIETPLLRGMLEQMFPSVEVGLDTLGKVATLNRVAQPDEVGEGGVVPVVQSGQLRATERPGRSTAARSRRSGTTFKRSAPDRGRRLLRRSWPWR